MCNHKVSCWQKASAVAACLQVAVVACSLYFIWSQLRQQKLQLAQQTRQLEQQVSLSTAANTQALVELITPLNLKVTDRGMAEIWVKGQEGIDKVPDEKEREIQTQQYTTLVASFMIFYENAYSQCRAGLLLPDIYDGWNKDLAEFLEAHDIGKHWEESKHLYRKDFSDHISQILTSQKSTPQQPLPTVQCK